MHHATVRPVRVVAVGLVVVLFVLGGSAPVGADHKPHGGHPEGSSVSRPVEAAEPGWIWVPTAGPDRIFQPISGHGVTLWYLDTITPGAVFAVEPQKRASGACVFGNCLQTLDFDIVFYKRGTGGVNTVTERYEALGDESGVVPPDAVFAFVFLKTPGVLPDGAKGFGFFYRQGTPGHDSLPSVG